MGQGPAGVSTIISESSLCCWQRIDVVEAAEACELLEHCSVRSSRGWCYTQGLEVGKAAGLVAHLDYRDGSGFLVCIGG